MSADQCVVISATTGQYHDIALATGQYHIYTHARRFDLRHRWATRSLYNTHLTYNRYYGDATRAKRIRNTSCMLLRTLPNTLLIIERERECPTPVYLSVVTLDI